MYFKKVESLKELRNEYKKLAKANHPDMGGSAETMAKINNEYEQLFEKLKNAKPESEQAKDFNKNIDKAIRDMIDKIINLPDIEIEIVGSWLWISGNSYPVRKDLKSAGFRFAGKKKQWYWHKGEYKKRSKKSLSMDQIRNLYGSEKVETKKQACLVG